ncbi:prepilin-type N-terminal cleavage/methylation domain-containing protein [Salisediminibacterium halotolerans]|uniref:Type IV pilus assembly protein PilA n=1 Tax=Salisediminibacterium halotolerans TaxID=517425 RepID=A0A1H9R3C4_9BACI|nr:prepilin-type N-terminal cleavage/methylation domain-containing protein [Salisediminibacterium haloalkalitolerans]SER67341.1 type IV pilus assembly protein PilA [Salisediminibacterium haloalkalitolerans]
MKKRLQQMKNQKGLTLVELLAVIVILGIIAAIAVPAIGNIIDNAREDAHESNAESLYNAARLAVTSENETDETTFSGVSNGDEDNLVDNGYLDSYMIDPESDNEEYGTAEVTYDPDGDGDSMSQYKISLTTDDETIIYEEQTISDIRDED